MSDFWYITLVLYIAATVFGLLWTLIEEEDNPRQKGLFVAVLLGPLTLLILSPIILVKLVAVTFKKRGLVASWLSLISDTYKKAVK